MTPSRAQRHFKTLLSAFTQPFSFALPIANVDICSFFALVVYLGLRTETQCYLVMLASAFRGCIDLCPLDSPSYSAKPHPTWCRIKRPSYYGFFRSSSSLSRWWPTFVWSWEKPAGFICHRLKSFRSFHGSEMVFGGGNTHTWLSTPAHLSDYSIASYQ